GDVHACFDFSGTVVFTLNAVGATTPITDTSTTLSITKQVRDTQNNQPNFGPSVTANNGDTVDFHIVVTNTGSNPAHNVVISDPSVNGLRTTSGTNLTVTPFTLPNDLAPGASVPVDFSAVYTATTSVTNVATVSASNAPSASAQAVVNPATVVTPTGNPQLKITKQ